MTLTHAWRTQTCEDCAYQVEGMCKYSPPTIRPNDCNSGALQYPPVSPALGVFEFACGRWEIAPDAVEGGLL